MRVGKVRVSLPVLELRQRGTAFLEQPVRTLLNPPESTGMAFWSANPYLGCEFGCVYCYARFAHRFALERATGRTRPPGPGPREGAAEVRPWQAFEREILVKRRADFVAALDRDLARLRKRSASGRQMLAIGTATDPYQPAERRFRLTRLLLERLGHERGLRISIVTKSPLVRRDIPILAALARRHEMAVNLSLISLDVRLIRVFEPRSPLPHARLRGLRLVARAGLNAGVFCAPVLPGVTDRADQLRVLLQTAASAGARFAQWAPLRLSHAERAPFFPALARVRPDLVARYRAAYARARSAPERYREALAQRFRALAAEARLPTTPFGSAGEPEWEQLRIW
jgi:DNA repair photolyase